MLYYSENLLLDLHIIQIFCGVWAMVLPMLYNFNIMGGKYLVISPLFPLKYSFSMKHEAPTFS